MQKARHTLNTMEISIKKLDKLSEFCTSLCKQAVSVPYACPAPGPLCPFQEVKYCNEITRDHWISYLAKYGSDDRRKTVKIQERDFDLLSLPRKCHNHCCVKVANNGRCPLSAGDCSEVTDIDWYIWVQS